MATSWKEWVEWWMRWMRWLGGWLGGWVGGLVLLAKKPPLILCSLRALTDGASSSRLGSVLQ